MRYVHSEKDRQTMIAVSEHDGEMLGKYTVPIPNVYDGEDMAVGPNPLPAPGVVSTLVEVADITLPIINGKRSSAQITAASFHPHQNRLPVLST